jgi:DNA-binding NarL/FixJ family response regulator
MKALFSIHSHFLLSRLKDTFSTQQISYETVENETISMAFENGSAYIILTDHQDFLSEIADLRQHCSLVKILFIVDSNDTSVERFFGLMELGVDGIISSQFSSNTLTNALQEISQGMGYICPRFAKSLLDYFQTNKSRVSQLSQKELMVVKLLVKGETYSRIAETLNMSINTVRFHVKNIYRKHDIHNKTLLSRYFHDLVIDTPRAIKQVYNEV